MIKALLKNTLIKNTLKISGLLLVALVVYTLIVTLIQHLSKRKSESAFFTSNNDATQTKNIAEEIITKGNNRLSQTWCIWIKLDNMNYNYGSKKSILTRQGVETPKIEISPKTNSLEVGVAKENGGETDIIPNIITVNSWTHITLVLTQKYMETWINGKLMSTKKLNGIPKLDDSNVLVNKEGGFAGYIKNLRFFNKQLSAKEILNIYNKEKPREYIPVISWIQNKLYPKPSEAAPKDSVDKDDNNLKQPQPKCPPCENNDN